MPELRFPLPQPERAEFARSSGCAYGARMLAVRFLSMIIAFAMLMAPAAMFGGGPAMATEHGAMAALTAGHCEEEGNQEEKQSQPEPSCCIATCAAIAAPENAAMGRSQQAGSPYQFTVVAAASGLDPEAETPPPRVAPQI